MTHHKYHSTRYCRAYRSVVFKIVCDLRRGALVATFQTLLPGSRCDYAVARSPQDWEALRMPGKRWAKQERRSLRQQIAAGLPPHDIRIENRSWAGICYMLRALRIRWSNRWTRSQTRSLIAQIRQGNKLPSPSPASGARFSFSIDR